MARPIQKDGTLQRVLVGGLGPAAPPVDRPARRFHTQGTRGLLIGLRPVPSANDPRQKGPADTKGRDLTALPARWVDSESGLHGRATGPGSTRAALPLARHMRSGPSSVRRIASRRPIRDNGGFHVFLVGPLPRGPFKMMPLIGLINSTVMERWRSALRLSELCLSRPFPLGCSPCAVSLSQSSPYRARPRLRHAKRHRVVVPSPFAR